MDAATIAVLRVTLQVSAVATMIVLVPGVLAGYVLARRDFRGKSVVSTIVSLPLVLPPTAVGYLLLRALAADGPLGRERIGFELDILLTWKGAVLASSIMALPLVVHTARATFEGIDPRLETMARTLGHGRRAVFLRTTLPLASRGLLAATLLGFTRAIGEFGATVTIAGNIPGRTQTLATAIFFAQQGGRDAQATFFLCLALVIGFAAVWASERLARGAPRHEIAR